MKRDKLFDLWEGRHPEFEVQYEEPIIKVYVIMEKEHHNIRSLVQKF